jgi:hypothetical protein
MSRCGSRCVCCSTTTRYGRREVLRRSRSGQICRILYCHSYVTSSVRGWCANPRSSSPTPISPYRARWRLPRDGGAHDKDGHSMMNGDAR